MVDFATVPSFDIPVEQRVREQAEQIDLLNTRVVQLEARLKAITESLTTLLTKEASEAMIAVAGLKVYKAEVAMDKAKVTDKSFLCTREGDSITIVCGDKPIALERMPPSAQRAMESAFAQMPNAPSFYVNLFMME